MAINGGITLGNSKIYQEQERNKLYEQTLKLQELPSYDTKTRTGTYGKKERTRKVLEAIDNTTNAVRNIFKALSKYTGFGSLLVAGGGSLAGIVTLAIQTGSLSKGLTLFLATPLFPILLKAGAVLLATALCASLIALVVLGINKLNGHFLKKGMPDFNDPNLTFDYLMKNLNTMIEFGGLPKPLLETIIKCRYEYLKEKSVLDYAILNSDMQIKTAEETYQKEVAKIKENCEELRQTLKNSQGKANDGAFVNKTDYLNADSTQKREIASAKQKRDTTIKAAETTKNDMIENFNALVKGNLDVIVYKALNFVDGSEPKKSSKSKLLIVQE